MVIFPACICFGHVPEARVLNSFLLSVITDADSLVDSVLRELDQQADAVRLGHKRHPISGVQPMGPLSIRQG